MGRLDGRRVLLTGAAGGIGSSIAEAYAAEGARLALSDVAAGDGLQEVAERCRAHGGVAVVVPGDAGDEAESREIVARAEGELGGVDVLVCAAGIASESPVAQMEVAVWDEMIRVDLRSVFLCTRWALPGMLERGWGRVIPIASQLGIKGSVSLAHYAAAKAGVIGFTKSLAREVAARGVLVNAIAPGPIETPMVAVLSDEYKATIEAGLPLGRFGVPAEVAPTAVLLASEPDGNLYVGQVLGPNSGDVMP